MIPVEQTIMGGDSLTPGRRGNCLQACVASVFELSLEEVPHFVAEENWYGAFSRWVAERGFALISAWHHVDEDDPMKLTGYPSDPTVWIASVLSPRIVRPDGTRGAHAVVMRGDELVWDPHPQREMGHLGFTGFGYAFAAPDPARLILRA